ncbi:hypothetical protein JL721_3906 [Aureococcus anophagefferens]|nr:hypothetical protein JL721_3906 [Aureococcus anophagefferens]
MRRAIGAAAFANAEDGCDRDDDDDDDDDDDEPCGGGGKVSLRVVNARVYRAEANLALLLRDAVNADILFRLADAMARDETSDLRSAPAARGAGTASRRGGEKEKETRTLEDIRAAGGMCGGPRRTSPRPSD